MTTKRLMGHYAIKQELAPPLVEYARYVLTDGTETKRVA
jgi:hypothetical protein